MFFLSEQANIWRSLVDQLSVSISVHHTWLCMSALAGGACFPWNSLLWSSVSWSEKKGEEVMEACLFKDNIQKVQKPLSRLTKPKFVRGFVVEPAAFWLGFRPLLNKHMTANPEVIGLGISFVAKYTSLFQVLYLAVICKVRGSTGFDF